MKPYCKVEPIIIICIVIVVDDVKNKLPAFKISLALANLKK